MDDSSDSMFVPQNKRKDLIKDFLQSSSIVTVLYGLISEKGPSHSTSLSFTLHSLELIAES